MDDTLDHLKMVSVQIQTDRRFGTLMAQETLRSHKVVNTLYSPQVLLDLKDHP